MKKVEKVVGDLTKEEVCAILAKTLQQVKNGFGQLKAKAWTEELVELRRRYIIYYAVHGWTNVSIMNDLCDNIGCHKSVAKEYIKDAYHSLVADAAEFKESDRQTLISKFEDIAEECRSRGDNKTAIKALEEVAKLKGLAIDKVELQGEQTITFNFGQRD